MISPMRRGACPRLAEPMPTGDGLLARLAPIGTTTLDAFVGLCAAGRLHGNGILEVTSRGSIQVRGITDVSAEKFADAVGALDIDVADGFSVTTDPLAGLGSDGILDANALAAELRARLSDRVLDALSPKTSVVIDGGGALGLDSVAADFRLCAMTIGDQAFWHVAAGGTRADARPLGAVVPQHAAEIAEKLLARLAGYGPLMRADQIIRENGVGAFLVAAGNRLVHLPGRPRRQAVPPIGTHALRDGRVALGIGLPFGHAHADELDKLVDAARHAHAGGVRTAPDRVFLIIGAAPALAGRLRESAERLGFIVSPDDPRRSIAACAGAPGCASGEIPARALAPLIAVGAAPLLDGSVTVHISGCPKGCAHAGAAALTLVGAAGKCRLVVGGSARDAASGEWALEQLPAGFARLADRVRCERRHDERSSDVLARLGAGRVASLLEAPHG